MKNTRLKRLCALALTAALGMSVLAGCGSTSADEKGKSSKLIYNLGADPATIDPTLNTAVDGSTVIGNAFEGLMRLDGKDQPIPGVAKEYTVSEDGLVYTFKLREDAKWSDGVQVKAEDFAYSWTRALTKATGAEYAYQLFYIKNGEKYYNGKVAAEELGIKVVDATTLEVTLEAPTAYFLSLMAFPTYMPLRKDIVDADPEKWATKVETYVTNGPFKLTDWKPADEFVFAKNENYWNKDEIKLDTLVMKMVTDEGTALAELRAGTFDMIDSVASADIEQAKAEGLATIYPNLGSYYFIFNMGNNQDKLDPEVQKALSNKKVRQALSLAIDRKAIVEKVTKGGQEPAYAFVPNGTPSTQGDNFADTKYLEETANIEKAKQLLAEAGYPEGKGLPEFEFMYNSEGGHKDIAQVLQSDWAKIGVKVNLANQEWKVFLKTRVDGGFQIARHGWSADYTDPMTFLDMWVTGGGNNDAHFSNAEYDKLIHNAKLEQDPAKRDEYFRKAEDILMDEMPIVPLYFYTKVKGAKPEVKGVKISTLGQVYFDEAYMK